jgi:type VI secretion system secreted protein VgrG
MDLFPHSGRISFYLSLADGSDQELQVRLFSGDEKLSELFGFELELACEATIAPPQAVGQPAVLVVGDDTCVFHGVVGMFEFQGSEADGSRVYYRALLVPTVWRLGLGRNCRIFQDKTVKQIVETLLKEWGLAEKQDFAFALDPGTTLEPRVYCVQYQESDWAFICRLLEEEGIHYYFVHERSGDETDQITPAGFRDKLVLTDAPAQHPAIRVPAGHPVDPGSDKPALAVHGPTHQNVRREHITGLVVRQEVVPGSCTVRDQVFDMPWLLDTSNETQAQGQGRPIEVFEYIGGPKSRPTGDLPQLRLELLQGPQLQFFGSATCPGMSAGGVFVLEDYPLLDTLGEKDHQLLLAAVHHQGVQPQAESSDAGGCRYGNGFVAILRRQPFRPKRRTPRPVIAGVQSAIVVGPPKEEIYTDDLGRVKVQFPWDRLGKNNERSSCWVPVAQTWSAAGWGTLFTPRINQQVLVQFLDGDPDQPLIVGQAYHLHNKPPYLPKRKTVSTIETDSSPGHGGYNEIRFEDQKGSEELYVRAQLDRNDWVGRNYTTTVGNDSTNTVGNDLKETVKRDYTQKIGRHKDVTVEGNLTEKIPNGTVTLQAKGPMYETVENARTVSIGALYETVKGKCETIVTKGDATLGVKEGAYNAFAKKSVTVVSIKDQVQVSGKKAVVLTADDNTIVNLKPSEIQAGSKKVTVAGKEKVEIAVGGSSITLEKNKVTLAQGRSMIVLEPSGVTISGVMIKLN